MLNPDSTVPLVGASGAIAGVMGAYLVLFPRHQVMTLVFFRVVAIPAVVFLGIWFVSQFLLAGDASGIAWEAHVAGFVFGAAGSGVAAPTAAATDRFRPSSLLSRTVEQVGEVRPPRRVPGRVHGGRGRCPARSHP